MYDNQIHKFVMEIYLQYKTIITNIDRSHKNTLQELIISLNLSRPHVN